MMRVIEELLYELTPNNLGKSLEAIEGQLEYYTSHAMEVQGISLIPILDKLPKKYSSEGLRSNGYVLTLAQFKEDCEKYLKLAQDHPIIFNGHLKRLYRGIEVFKRNILAGNVHNTVASDEFKQQFVETMKKLYLEGTDAGEKITKELASFIHQLVDDEITSVNLAWYNHQLQNDLNQPFTEMLAKDLKYAWSKGALEKVIVDQLAHNKNSINSIDALITCFRQNKLPETIYSDMKSKVIRKITADLDAKHITENDDFGALFTKRRNSVVQNDAYSILSSILVDWQNNQVADCIDSKIQKYLRAVISEMRETLDNNLSHQFEELAVHAFLTKLQNEQCDNEFTQKMHSISLKTALAFVYESEDHNNICRQTIYKNVMGELYARWCNKNLAPETQKFITQHALAFVNKLTDRIENQVWARNIVNLENKFADAIKVIEKLTERLNYLTAKPTQIDKKEVMVNDNQGKTAFFKI